MTLAGFMAGVISILITGTGLMVAAKIPIWPHVISTVVLVLSLGAALFSAVHAARPTEWYYTGNNPKFWVSDIEKRRELKDALAGQAALYAVGIAKNSAILGGESTMATARLETSGIWRGNRLCD